MNGYARELEVALDAVRAAARVCRAVQARLVTAETLEKKDKSPVTVADFASQAIVCQRLQAVLPDDRVVGEEDSADLRGADSAELLAAVVREVSGELEGPVDAEGVLAWIDRGGAAADTERYWTLDPIDGTKGFLRGEQYAVALGLIEKGEVVLGVLGCPNLSGSAGPGLLFSAVRGQGAREHALETRGEDRAIGVAAVATPSEARFCESVESAHSDQGESAQIARRLGITQEPFRIDSQCKYAAVARGDASIYLRMPTRKDYREKIWDHAAGKLVVEEAGGRVSDVFGRELDFGKGRTLEDNRGIVATSGAIHDEVVAAVRAVRGE
ncbi:MAG: 3'(2'),5'-bisphosphate nucleotidase [Deltaproteobacteria bacterium]|nr:3'(2'),5'-bisphosphate nucleotidase [Deltaproteobacteria bacterium]